MWRGKGMVSFTRLANGSGVSGLQLARAAEAEQLKPMHIDPVAAPAGDLGDGLRDSAPFHLCGPAAAGAHDVVVVPRRARHVGVLAIGQLDALQDAKIGQQVKGTKEGGAAEPLVSAAGDRFQLGSGEVPIVPGDQIGHDATWASQAVACLVQRSNDGILICHDWR
jgi:hypothetical protein